MQRDSVLVKNLSLEKELQSKIQEEIKPNVLKTAELDELWDEAEAMSKIKKIVEPEGKE